MLDKKQRSRGLGKGLDAIFLDNTAEEKSIVITLRVTEIEPRINQPRKIFDAEALASLADSIAANGLIQPIAVRPSENGLYQIIAGERRWRAAKLAGIGELPAMILDLDDRAADEYALIENLQREDLNAMEEASAYTYLTEKYGLTQEDISKRVGKSRSAVANSMRLNELPPEVISLIEDNSISAGHGRALLGLKIHSDIVKAAFLIIKQQLSVRAVEELVRKMNRESDEKREILNEELQQDLIVDYTAELEKKILRSFGRKIKINDKNPRKPKSIVIEYKDNEDLENIIRRVCGEEISL